MESRGLPKTRIRLYLDEYGMNKNIQVGIEEVNSKILQLKKLGGPSKPTTIKRLDYTKKDEGSSTKSFITSGHEQQYINALEKYKKDFDMWNSYISKEYMVAKSAHKCITLLSNLKQLLDNPTNNKDEITEITTTLQKVKPGDLLIKKYPKEEVSDFVARKNATTWEPATFSEFIKEKSVSVNNIPTIVDHIKSSYSNVELFLLKRDYSNDKKRFSKEGVEIVTKTVEGIMRELIVTSIENARESGSKKVLPEHIMSTSDKLYYNFYELLPQYRILQERRERKTKYETECAASKNAEVKKLMEDFKRQDRDFNARKDLPSFDNIKSFEEKEEIDGFVDRIEKVNNKGQTRITYKWKQIETWDVDNESSFVIYSKNYFDEFLKCYEIDFSKESTSCILKVASATHKVINNLVIEFLNYLIPRLEDTKKLCGNKKTTDGKMVLYVIKNILSQRVIELTDTQRYVYSELEKLMPVPKRQVDKLV